MELEQEVAPELSASVLLLSTITDTEGLLWLWVTLAEGILGKTLIF